MTDAIRWLALLPDPVTGLDQPVAGSDGSAREWCAPNREFATRLIQRDLTTAELRLVSIVSAIDWASRSRVPQRAKLYHEPHSHPRYAIRNPDERCQTCGATVKVSALYCAAHRSWKRRKAYVDALPESPAPAAP